MARQQPHNTNADKAPARPPPLTIVLDSGDEQPDVSSAPSPSSSMSSASSPGVSPADDDSATHCDANAPERRKRGRVTPEQLAVLEAVFAADRNPNAMRRREISDQLGMYERQTQIWFQNRRAKAKQADGGKNGGRGKHAAASSKPASPVASPARTQSMLFPSQDLELQRRIHEDDPVIVVPCTELTIGTWTRVTDDAARHGLLAYICEAQHRLSWFVHYRDDAFEHAVRMDIPLDSVADAALVPSPPSAANGALTGDSAARLTLLLAHPPLFSMTVARPDGAAPMWASCGDWTEGCQASAVLRHELAGACAPLAYLLARLRAEPALAHRTSPYLLSLPPPAPPAPPAALQTAGLPMRQFAELSLQQHMHSPAASRRPSLYDAPPHSPAAPRRGSLYDPAHFSAYTPASAAAAFAAARLSPTLALHTTQLATPPGTAYATALSSPLLMQPPGYGGADYAGEYPGEYALYDLVKTECVEHDLGAARPLPPAGAALPASLSRRPFCGAHSPRPGAQGALAGYAYLETPPSSRASVSSRSDGGTPDNGAEAFEGFVWAEEA